MCIRDRHQKPSGTFDSGRYACHRVRKIGRNALRHTGSHHCEGFDVLGPLVILSRMIILADIISICGGMVERARTSGLGPRTRGQPLGFAYAAHSLVNVLYFQMGSSTVRRVKLANRYYMLYRPCLREAGAGGSNPPTPINAFMGSVG